MKGLHDTHSTVSHYPVGLEHLDNTIETDRLSLILCGVCGRNKDWMLAFSLCQCTIVPPVQTKEQRCSAILTHQLKSSSDVLSFLSHSRGQTPRQSRPRDVLSLNDGGWTEANRTVSAHKLITILIGWEWGLPFFWVAVNVELSYTNVETWQLFSGCWESEYSTVMNSSVALWFINLCLLV